MDAALMEIRASWPGELIRGSVCARIVKHLMGLSDNELSETQSAALGYAYRRCSFVSLDKKQRFGTTVERVYALRNSERWNELLKAGDGASLLRTQIENTTQTLPITDRERSALGDAVNWGAAFERLQSETVGGSRVAAVAALPRVAASR